MSSRGGSVMVGKTAEEIQQDTAKISSIFNRSRWARKSNS
eukprot:UN07856